MKFVIGFLITIGLLILVFILIFRGGNDSSEAVQQVRLVDYANTSKVMQFIDKGPVTADQTHDEIRITVSNVESSVEVFQGYENNLIVSKTFANNSTSYADFLRALQLAGYTKGNTDKALQDDRGFCPSGHRYIMLITDGGRTEQRFWTSTCKGGSFKGNATAVRNLFRKQIPNYDTAVAVPSTSRSNVTNPQSNGNNGEGIPL